MFEYTLSAKDRDGARTKKEIEIKTTPRSIPTPPGYSHIQHETLYDFNFNDPPVWDVIIGNRQVHPKSPCQFSVHATDPNGDILTYSICAGSVEDLPAGASVDANSGLFSWTPAISQIGCSYKIRFMASDGRELISQDVILTVANESPVWSVIIGDRQAPPMSPCQFSVRAADPNSDILTYSAENLPVGASFNSSSGMFSWVPAISQIGSYKIRFMASDGMVLISQYVTLTVSNNLPISLEPSAWINVGPSLGVIGTVYDADLAKHVLETTTTFAHSIDFAILSRTLSVAGYDKLRFTIKDKNDFVVYVRVKATDGSEHYLQYWPAAGAASTRVSSSGSYVFMPLDPALKDGQWHTVERDMARDFRILTGKVLASVQYFGLRGDYRLAELTLGTQE